MRTTGFVLGLVLALAIVLAWRVPASTGRLGLDVRVAVNQSGELHVEPVGTFVSGTGLEATAGRDTAHGKTTVTNQTGSKLDVRVRALPSSHDVDRLLLVDVRAGDELLYRGPLGGLRSWSRDAVRVGPAHRFPLDVRVRVPASAGNGYRGRIEDVTLELRSTPVGGRNGH